MIDMSIPGGTQRLRPRITVIGVGGAGCNAVNNMIADNLEGVEFLVANTDAQALDLARAEKKLQLGLQVTGGLGAGARPDVGREAAIEAMDEIDAHLEGANMVFITAGMGGGTGTGAAPVIAERAREHNILTVGVVTKPFHFEGSHRMRLAEAGIEELQQFVDTLIVIPNQNLFRIATEKTTFAQAFEMADNVLHSGVRGVTDLMVMPGLINLDFADIRTVMSEMGKAMMGTGEADGEDRAKAAAQAAISNPLLDEVSLKGARAMLINITGGMDIALYEVDEAVNHIRNEVDPDANIIFGSIFDQEMEGIMRVSVVATGIDSEADARPQPKKPALTVVAQQPRQIEPEPAPAPEVAAAPIQPALIEDPVEESEPEDTAETVADAFIPEPPAVARPTLTASAPAPDPMEEAAFENAPHASETAGKQSLFRRVTGAMRGAEGGARVTPPPVPAEARTKAAAQHRLAMESPAPRLRPTKHTETEDDLLEIPAFLRRQAN